MSFDADKFDPYDLVSAVAEAEGTDPLNLEPPLGDVVDVDALELLLCGTSGETSVTLTYHGWHIEVTGDLEISLSKVPADE